MSEINESSGVGDGLADGNCKGAEKLPPAGHDLEVLFPDITVEIGIADGSKEKINMRELRFGEQIKYASELARVLAAIKGVFGHPESDLGAIIDALAACSDDMVTLVLAATGKSRDWFDALPGADGEALLACFWSANRGFFLRRLLDYPAMQLRNAVEQAGAASSPPSSDTATEQAG
jgi:hypothetical protein